MPREVRERQMLDAAVEVFARRGYRAASMDEIAELAGASKPLVYLYLNSKEDLFSACIRREATALMEAVRAAVDPAAPAESRLWSGLRAFFAHTAEHPAGWAVLSCQARTHGEPFAVVVAELRQEIVDLVTRLLAETADGAAAAGERDAGGAGALPGHEVSGLAHALVGAAESLAGWANDRTGAVPTAKETAATLMNVAWVGLENLMNGQRWTASARP
ncbi:TetR family transcriptional regulator [Streptomyces cinnamoneus]|uniref:TetR family transcriptional regulator n=1 Tax=Streptomyces cinnamoneus TaxID=53446 RepID=A0A2G1XJL5_STRCJ|nr:TetR/AcrR family transcriptional regulator [Streptomyces cinnamoneus]PHQ51329.1 TetR family transcriptional regulator [Streptomyces cinnamoneus]PPT16547.1 TetR/AcrR family transcriptional regulator [Streptomyces cinnamoneus]